MSIYFPQFNNLTLCPPQTDLSTEYVACQSNIYQIVDI